MQPIHNFDKIPIPEVVERDENELWEEWNSVNNDWENKFSITSPQALLEELFQITEISPLVDFGDQNTD